MQKLFFNKVTQEGGLETVNYVLEENLSITSVSLSVNCHIYIY